MALQLFDICTQTKSSHRKIPIVSSRILLGTTPGHDGCPVKKKQNKARSLSLSSTIEPIHEAAVRTLQLSLETGIRQPAAVRRIFPYSEIACLRREDAFCMMGKRCCTGCCPGLIVESILFGVSQNFSALLSRGILRHPMMKGAAAFLCRVVVQAAVQAVSF